MSRHQCEVCWKVFIFRHILIESTLYFYKQYKKGKMHILTILIYVDTNIFFQLILVQTHLIHTDAGIYILIYISNTISEYYKGLGTEILAAPSTFGGKR